MWPFSASFTIGLQLLLGNSYIRSHAVSRLVLKETHVNVNNAGEDLYDEGLKEVC